MMVRILRALTVTVGFATLMIVLPCAAQATIVITDHYSVSESTSFDDCGFVIDSAFQTSGTIRVRVDKTSGGEAFLGSDSFEYREVFTNPETGAWFVQRGHGSARDIKATLVEGNLYSFRAHEVGQPVVLENSDGQVVLRDRGLIVYEVIFDTLGDKKPGGVPLVHEIRAVHGPHAGLADDFDFCALAWELIG